MPLLWKKAGISRISRLMADLHPTKPCSSMVLQTGFPTSLVDLFVKNCDRLKKPINKRKNKKKHHHRNHQDFSVSDPGSEEKEKEKEKDHPVNLNNCQFKTKVNFDCQKKSIVGRFESESDEEGLNIRGGFDNSGCNNRDQRGVLYAVFIVFVVVILALISIKILTLGITMSACFLIFLEYIGKQIFRCYVCNFVRFKAAFWVFLCKREDEAIIESKVEEEHEDEQEEEEEEEDSIELNSSVDEIEARFDAVARVEPDSDGTRMNLSPGRWGYSDIEVEEEEDDCFEVTALEKQHSRGRRRRSSREFMKKLVPKKWRSTKKAAKARKGGKEITEEYASSSEFSSSHSSEDKLARNEEIEELYNNNSESNKGRRITFLIEEESKMSSENSVESEKSYNEEEAVIKNERKSEKGSAFLLLVVALAGLVGGRIIALVLTVISCVIIQLVTNRRGRCSKAMC